MCLPTVFSRSMVVSAVCASIAVGITLVVMSITVRAQQEGAGNGALHATAHQGLGKKGKAEALATAAG